MSAELATRARILETLNALPDHSFLAAIVAARAAAEVMALTIVDDPTPELAFVAAVTESVIGVAMGWKGAIG